MQGPTLSVLGDSVSVMGMQVVSGNVQICAKCQVWVRWEIRMLEWGLWDIILRKCFGRWWLEKDILIPLHIPKDGVLQPVVMPVWLECLRGIKELIYLYP